MPPFTTRPEILGTFGVVTSTHWLASATGMASLEPDGEVALGDSAWEAAWSVEIERRLRDFDEGRTTAISYEEFESRMRARPARP